MRTICSADERGKTQQNQRSSAIICGKFIHSFSRNLVSVDPNLEKQKKNYPQINTD
jgi:hypothetical protein